MKFGSLNSHGSVFYVSNPQGPLKLPFGLALLRE